MSDIDPRRSDRVGDVLRSVREAVHDQRASCGNEDTRAALEIAGTLSRLSALPPAGGSGRWRFLTGRVKRPLTAMLRWYLTPLAERQSRFNEAVVRGLDQLNAQQERLLRQQQALEDRLERIERLAERS